MAELIVSMSRLSSSLEETGDFDLNALLPFKGELDSPIPVDIPAHAVGACLLEKKSHQRIRWNGTRLKGVVQPWGPTSAGRVLDETIASRASSALGNSAGRSL